MRPYFLPRLIAALPALILGSGLICIAGSWYFSQQRGMTTARAGFDDEVEHIVTALDKRMAAHEQTLRGAASLIQRSHEVGSESWRVFVRQLATSDALEGTIAVGHVSFEPRGPVLHNIVVLTATDENTFGRMGQAAQRDLRNLWPDRASPRTRLLMLDDNGAVLTADSGRPAQSAMLVVPVLADGQRAGGETVRGFVFSYFSPSVLLEAGLRNVGRKGRYTISPQNSDAAATVLFEDKAEGEPHGYAALQASRTIQVGDAVWDIRAQGAADEFRTNSELSPTTVLLGGFVLAWTLGAGLLSRRLRRELVTAAGHGAAPLAQALSHANEIIDAAPDAMVVLDEQGQVLRLNSAAEQLLGSTSDSLRGRSISDFMRDVSPERARAALSSGQISLSGETRRVRLVSELTHLEHPIPVEVHISARAPDFSRFICILRDTVKERRQAEEMHLYKLAMESSANAIVISDVRLPNQPILYVNPAFERMTGYDLTETFGHQRWFLNGRDTDPVVIAKIKTAMERGTDCQATIKNYRKDGSPIWLNVMLAPVRNQVGVVTHYISVETDVTETKQIEAALSERRQQLDAIFTLSADGFAAFGLDHHVTYVNPAFLRITGLEQTEVVGASLEHLDGLFESVRDPSQTYISIAEQVRLAAQGGARITPRAETVYLRNPAPRVLQRSLRKASGGATDFVLYLRDVTRESEVDRMKSEFLSSAAHELRTPMASVYGFAELLLRRKYPEERQREMLETIHRQAKHLSNLVNELLDLARIEARAGKDFKMVEQSILPLVTEAVQSLLMPNDHRKVELALPDSVPLVRADTSKMRQALTNILSNAYKYSPNGGRIRLWIEERRASDRDFVGVCVADEGIGMTPEQLARACERFYRADSSGNIPGTGLGLSLVKEIMELQGGAIELASEHGVGTTVRLWLPVSSSSAQLRSAAA